MNHDSRHRTTRTSRARRAPDRRTARDRARRELSQNFLADRDAIRRYARSVGDGPGGLVVEAGAGDGRITAALAVRADRVIAYELDPVWAARLRDRCRDLGNVTCVTGDFLRARPPGGPFHLAGNIPYAATSRIVGWALSAPGLVSATLVTQLEYARKRTGDYGRWSRLTVETWPVFSWRMAGRISRDRFRPVPRVDSAVLRLDRRARPLLPSGAMDGYTRCVELGFGGKGGALHASLRQAHPKARLDAAFRAAGLARDTVVAFVRPDQWLTLFRVLEGLPPLSPPAAAGRGGPGRD
ncbi:ErmE/ErmH/ErmO/ErmR family 23S rRNA (adenine(2058)-N(6))-methyltransferase [Actinomadura rubrisoli]|uniref:ErmE/ErmH/ErmO/ErmR family 23S rRNA (Adenine(2058)-N(6))-methyltransferase n=1 Tax=Actinomadura rubrisoli TaxID=2530368 RepID=A0A4V2YZE2_9ACTN|nr:ErmE/ErmH/ErmO/ErmR family 23S rRNA (adenine(2058)-N(6))-methyltransferase [Actinomadura rubrisoli]TDD96677.1 ErmE/ErmH/ErmO/ErmR family 23S rRNA (adenine(2058)-N(6))-methyltransferase [Actinomadura rubrisoli]